MIPSQGRVGGNANPHRVNRRRHRLNSVSVPGATAEVVIAGITCKASRPSSPLAMSLPLAARWNVAAEVADEAVVLGPALDCVIARAAQEDVVVGFAQIWASLPGFTRPWFVSKVSRLSN